MINPNDIRMGNYLLAAGSLTCGAIHRVTGIENDIVFLGGVALSFDNVGGIPLSEEWLIKMGFSDISGHLRFNGVRLSGDYLFCKKFDEGGRITLELPNSFGKTELEYVHQLQNYIFSLTGEELEVKL